VLIKYDKQLHTVTGIEAQWGMFFTSNFQSGILQSQNHIFCNPFELNSIKISWLARTHNLKIGKFEGLKKNQLAPFNFLLDPLLSYN
jgi:hypothetical protein